MKVLVAPDKFKGSLTAAQVVDTIWPRGLEQTRHPVHRLPLADGGDGSVAAAVAAGFRPHTSPWPAPPGDTPRPASPSTASPPSSRSPTPAACAPSPSGQLAPLAASSLGFGHAVRAALTPAREQGRPGARRHRPAPTAALGMLAALGALFRDADGQPVPAERRPAGPGPHRRPRPASPTWRAVEIVIAGDVRTRPDRPDGAAAVFGPQKGATPARSTASTAAWPASSTWPATRGTHALAATPGAGAAGGLGFAALLLGAPASAPGPTSSSTCSASTPTSTAATLVITGEGRIDDQTLHGKLPYVVAQHAAPRPTYAVVGLNQITPGSPLELAFTRIHQISDLTATDTRHDPDLTARILTQLGEAIATQLHTARTPSPTLRGAS